MSISKPLLIYTEHSWAGSGPVLEKAHRGTDTMALCLLLWGTAGRVGGQCAGASSTPSSWVGRMTEMLFLYQLQDFGQVIQQRSWGSQSPRPRQCVPRGMSSQELVTTAHSFPSPWSRPFWWMSWLRQGTTWPQPRNNLWSDWGPGRELTRIESHLSVVSTGMWAYTPFQTFVWTVRACPPSLGCPRLSLRSMHSFLSPLLEK